MMACLRRQQPWFLLNTRLKICADSTIYGWHSSMKFREFTLRYSRYSRVWKEATFGTRRKLNCLKSSWDWLATYGWMLCSASMALLLSMLWRNMKAIDDVRYLPLNLVTLDVEYNINSRNRWLWNAVSTCICTIWWVTVCVCNWGCDPFEFDCGFLFSHGN